MNRETEDAKQSAIHDSFGPSYALTTDSRQKKTTCSCMTIFIMHDIDPS